MASSYKPADANSDPSQRRRYLDERNRSTTRPADARRWPNPAPVVFGTLTKWPRSVIEQREADGGLRQSVHRLTKSDRILEIAKEMRKILTGFELQNEYAKTLENTGNIEQDGVVEGGSNSCKKSFDATEPGIWKANYSINTSR